MENKWISCEERLPDTDRTVLVYMGLEERLPDTDRIVPVYMCLVAMTAHYADGAWVQGEKGAGFPIITEPMIEYWREWDEAWRI